MPDISRRTLIKRAVALLALSKLASINALAANNPVQIGHLLAKGQKPSEGMDIPGIGAVKVEANPPVVRANKMLDINPGTIDALAKLI